MGNIIFVNRYFYPDLSATSQMLTDLACALARDGYVVRVVTSKLTYEDPSSNLPARENWAGTEVRRVWTTRFGRASLAGRSLDYASFYLSSFWELLRIAQPGDVIIAKTDPPLISVVAWLAAKLKRAKLVNWLQDVFPEIAVALGVMTWRPLVELTRWLRNASLRGAVMNIVLSQGMREYIVAQGVDLASVKIIHNWADGEKIKPVSRKENSLRQFWDLQDKFIVGYSGNMGRAHEFETVIGAMKRLMNDDHIVFLFIGGGAGRELLERAVKEFGLSNCLFKPYQARECLSESLSVADVHLVSLRPEVEGFIMPSKVYGIAAVGRPAIFIGNPDGEVGRWLTAYEFGFAVPIGAEKDLAEKIIKLKQQPDITARMGDKSRRCFEENFEYLHAVAAWKSLLNRFF